MKILRIVSPDSGVLCPSAAADVLRECASEAARWLGARWPQPEPELVDTALRGLGVIMAAQYELRHAWGLCIEEFLRETVEGAAHEAKFRWHPWQLFEAARAAKLGREFLPITWRGSAVVDDRLGDHRYSLRIREGILMALPTGSSLTVDSGHPWTGAAVEAKCRKTGALEVVTGTGAAQRFQAGDSVTLRPSRSPRYRRGFLFRRRFPGVGRESFTELAPGGAPLYRDDLVTLTPLLGELLGRPGGRQQGRVVKVEPPGVQIEIERFGVVHEWPSALWVATVDERAPSPPETSGWVAAHPVRKRLREVSR